MVRVGVIGLGMMGSTHLDVYAKLQNAQVVAVSDADPDRLSGRCKVGGNVEGQSQGNFNFDTTRRYKEGMELIEDNEVELVDICLITPLHVKYALAALSAGKHVLIEKPLANTSADAEKVVKAAKEAKGLAMPAMCMRFWPGWDWAKTAIDEQTYGRVLSATFRRVTEHPGGQFYTNGSQCGGALLDLHVHDTDFVQYCFGLPKAVVSSGYSTVSGAVDHLSTIYVYDTVPLVTAEGGWVMAKGFGFSMSYTINFERATATFTFDGQSHVCLFESNKEPQKIEFERVLGYEREIIYFLNCIENGEPPQIVTLQSAQDSLRIAEAEDESVKTGRLVTL